MIPVERTPEYLTQLGVTMTQSTTADPDINIFEEYLTAKPIERVACLFEYETAGFMYISELKEVVAVSMVLQPKRRLHKKEMGDRAIRQHPSVRSISCFISSEGSAKHCVSTYESS